MPDGPFIPRTGTSRYPASAGIEIDSITSFAGSRSKDRRFARDCERPYPCRAVGVDPSSVHRTGVDAEHEYIGVDQRALFQGEEWRTERKLGHGSRNSGSQNRRRICCETRARARSPAVAAFNPQGAVEPANAHLQRLKCSRRSEDSSCRMMICALAWRRVGTRLLQLELRNSLNYWNYRHHSVTVLLRCSTGDFQITRRPPLRGAERRKTIADLAQPFFGACDQNRVECGAPLAFHHQRFH